jgi:hypothetical protein
MIVDPWQTSGEILSYGIGELYAKRILSENVVWLSACSVSWF